MRILLISAYFPPQNAVASLRVHAFARHWAAQGAAVTVLTTQKRPDQNGLHLPCDEFEVVEVDFAVPKPLESLRRAHKTEQAADLAPGAIGETNHEHAQNLHEAATIPSAAHAAVRAGAVQFVRRWREDRGVFCSVRMPDLTDYWVKPALEWLRDAGSFDAVVSSSGPYTSHLVALSVKRSGQAGYWAADFRDLWVDNHLHRGVFPFTLREKTLERQVLLEADLLTTVSDGLARRLRERTMRPVEVIYNGYEPADVAALDAARIFDDDGKVRLVYTGTLYPNGQDPTPLFRGLAAFSQSRPDLAKRFRFCVAGRDSAQWAAYAEAYDVSQLVELRGQVTRSDALRMQRDAGALLLIDWKNPDEGVLTGKVFEYLQAGPPILVIGPVPDSPIGRLISKAGRGIHLGASPAIVKEKLITLFKDPAMLDRQRNEAVIAGLSRERQSLRMLELLWRGVGCAAGG